MIEHLLERFRSSPQRWLIVTGVTFLTALTSVLPQVDQLMATRAERSELEGQLTNAKQTVERLPDYEASLDKTMERLLRLRDQEVDETHVATLRSWLVDAARQAGCQVRRIDLSAPVRRPWEDDDNPLEQSAAKPKKAGVAPFALETRSVTFAATGSSIEVRSLLKTLDQDRRLKHAHSVELRPESRNRNLLQLDLTFWYFALVNPRGAA